MIHVAPRSPRRLAPALAAALPAMLLSPVAWSEPCPENAIQLRYGEGPFLSSRAQWDSTAVIPWTFGTIVKRAAYDVPNGTLNVSHSWTFLSIVLSRIVDEFRVVGVSAGTPVALSARLDVEADALDHDITPCGLRVYAHVRHGTEAASLEVCAPPGSQHLTPHESLTLPLLVTAGEPITLEFEVQLYVAVGSDGGEGWGSGRIGFDGLPPGASVVSCNGYDSDTTPASQPSWGRVKVRYR